jgi:3-oxoadipate enol-lactonase
VIALLDALNIEHAHLVGLSLGGCVAQQLVLDWSGRVARLVLVNTFACVDLGDPLTTLKLGLRLGLLTLLGLPVQAHFVARRLFPRPDQADLHQAAYQRLAANDPVVYRRSLAAIRRFDVRARLGEITCPTLVVAGERDGTVPLRAKRLLARQIPRAWLHVVAGSGHATPIDQFEIFNQTILEFLSSERVPVEATC